MAPSRLPWTLMPPSSSTFHSISVRYALGILIKTAPGLFWCICDLFHLFSLSPAMRHHPHLPASRSPVLPFLSQVLSRSRSTAAWGPNQGPTANHIACDHAIRIAAVVSKPKQNYQRTELTRYLQPNRAWARSLGIDRSSRARLHQPAAQPHIPAGEYSSFPLIPVVVENRCAPARR